ncbi:MAG: hypothetical protein NDI94_00100 [Candidatus Woesearchaeota archaeon]|nr:hypothetical protein [Candidatus Woesearchaeota archaeon]
MVNTLYTNIVQKSNEMMHTAQPYLANAAHAAQQNLSNLVEMYHSFGERLMLEGIKVQNGLNAITSHGSAYQDPLCNVPKGTDLYEVIMNPDAYNCANSQDALTNLASQYVPEIIGLFAGAALIGATVWYLASIGTAGTVKANASHWHNVRDEEKRSKQKN